MNPLQAYHRWKITEAVMNEPKTCRELSSELGFSETSKRIGECSRMGLVKSNGGSPVKWAATKIAKRLKNAPRKKPRRSLLRRR